MASIWRTLVDKFADWVQQNLVEGQKTLFIWPFFAGLLLIAIAYLCNILIVTDANNKGREVGYFAALNWTFTSCVIVPIAFETSALILRNARAALREASESGLFITANGEPAPVTAGEQIWREVVVETTSWLVIFLIFGEFVFIALWWDMSGSWLLGARQFTDQIPAEKVERDWTVAAFLISDVSRLANAAFSFICHVIMAGFWAAFIGVYTFVNVYCVRLNNLTRADNLRASAFVLVPDLRDRAHVFGYERVCRLLQQLMLFAGCTVAILMLMRLQNAYLLSDKTSLIELISPGLSSALKTTIAGNPLTGLGDLAGTLLQWYRGDLKTMITILICGLVGAFIVVIVLNVSAFFNGLISSGDFMISNGHAQHIVVPGKFAAAEPKLRALPASRVPAARPVQLILLMALAIIPVIYVNFSLLYIAILIGSAISYLVRSTRAAPTPQSPARAPRRTVPRSAPPRPTPARPPKRPTDP